MEGWWWVAYGLLAPKLHLVPAKTKQKQICKIPSRFLSTTFLALCQCCLDPTSHCKSIHADHVPATLASPPIVNAHGGVQVLSLAHLPSSERGHLYRNLKMPHRYESSHTLKRCKPAQQRAYQNHRITNKRLRNPFDPQHNGEQLQRPS